MPGNGAFFKCENLAWNTTPYFWCRAFLVRGAQCRVPTLRNTVSNTNQMLGLLMRDRKLNHLNATKHGIFAETAILSGEKNPEEFIQLHSDVIKEWNPVGVTEQDAALSIAKGIWRKRRLQKFIEIQLLKNNLDPNHGSYDERLCLQHFVIMIKREPETAFKQYSSRVLREDKIEYLNEKCPRSGLGRLRNGRRQS